MKDREPKRRIFHNKLSLLIAPLVAAVGIEGKVLFDRWTAPPAVSERRVPRVELDIRDLPPVESIDPQLSLLKQRKETARNISSSPLLTDPQAHPLDIRDLDRKAKQHIIDSMYLARLFLPLQEAASIEFSPNLDKVTFLGREFHLDHPLHPHLLHAIVMSKLNIQSLEAQKQLTRQRLTEMPYLSSSIEADSGRQAHTEQLIQDILWLYDQDLPIFVAKDGFALLSLEHVTNLARTLHEMNKHGLPFPRRIDYIKWKEGMAGGGWYSDHNQRGKEFTIVVTNRSGAGAITHELGHFVSDAVYLDPSNPRLIAISQEFYEERVRQLFEENPGVQDEKLTYAASVKQPDRVEDYAADFEMYLLHGEEFRYKMEYGSQRDPHAYRVLAGKYAFMGQGFEGVEYFTGGIPGERKFAAGARVAIKDEDTWQPGILLRLDTLLTPQNPAVFHGDVVEILEGPKIWIQRYGGEANYWKVRVVANGQQSERLIEGSSLSKEGWIPDSFFEEIASSPSQ